MIEAFIPHPSGGSAYFSPEPEMQPGSLPARVRAFLVEEYRRQACHGTAGFSLSGLNAGSGTHFSENVSAPLRAASKTSEALTAIRRLRNMAEYSDNWDGEGAPAPDRATIDAAIVVVGFLATEHLRIRATLNADGQPLILISRSDAEGEVTITSPQSIDFVWFAAAEEFGEAGLAFEGRRLPVEITEALSHMALAAA